MSVSVRMLCAAAILALAASVRLPAQQASGDARFEAAANAFIDAFLQHHPTLATYLGVHDFDDRLDDYSAKGTADEIAMLRTHRDAISAIAPESLSLDAQLDREQLLTAIDGQLLELETIKARTLNPDVYSSGVTQTAFIMVKRSFAPPEARLRSLIARERAMPAVFEAARANLVNPPAILTDIAIEQLDGNRAFFAQSVPEAFADVKDEALLREFRQANAAVLEAFDAYKQFLEKDLRPRSHGSFAIGADALRRKFLADEMVDLPLDRLLKIAEADLAKNQAQFKETAAKIAPDRTPAAVVESISQDHPAPSALLSTTQQMLDSLRDFIVQHEIATIPSPVPAKVAETPPFMRAMTSASMDIPGPFEKNATEAYYQMTLPDPSWPAERQNEFMRQWYSAAIANVSVHEVYPGHYLQFLYGPQFPSRVRKVFGAATNSEGWAHYCEQMMLDEGFHADDPRYRLAQLQDALLRDVRFIVGIRMHSQGMTVEQAQQMFERDAYEPGPVALSEAKRGTMDSTYGYYTMGKLMILKLRDDVRAKEGASFTLRGFHDRLLKLGPLPLPLVRRAMLGSTGDLFPAVTD